MNESIVIATDNPEEASMMMQLLKLAGVQPVDQNMINQPQSQEPSAAEIPAEEKTEEEELLEAEEDDDSKVVKDRDPTAEQLEQLNKLEPLPPLLRDFDLDAHVGLIQKLLKMDPRLVERQSTLSGTY